MDDGGDGRHSLQPAAGSRLAHTGSPALANNIYLQEKCNSKAASLVEFQAIQSKSFRVGNQNQADRSEAGSRLHGRHGLRKGETIHLFYLSIYTRKKASVVEKAKRREGWPIDSFLAQWLCV